MASEVNHLVLAVRDETAGDDDLPRLVTVVDPMARLAQFLVSGGWPLRPVPPAVVIHGAALRARRRLR